MGYTIGDVLTFLTVIFGTAALVWTAMLAARLLFSQRVDRAAEAIQERLGRTLLTGTLVAGIGIGLGLVLLNAPGGIPKLLGFVLLAYVLAIAVVGAAGLGQVAARRVLADAPECAPLAAFTRASAILVASSLLPGLGWLALFPAQLLLAVGAGLRAFAPKTRLAVVRRAEPETGS